MAYGYMFSNMEINKEELSTLIKSQNNYRLDQIVEDLDNYDFLILATWT